jgi:poly(A) polymerase Pap1
MAHQDRYDGPSQRTTSWNLNAIHRQFGVTAPISVVESNAREKEVTNTLLEELKRQKTIESEEEARTRWVHSTMLM